MNNNNVYNRNEWNFEDDYNANRDQFEKGDMTTSDLALQKTSQTFFRVESTLESNLKNTAFNLIEEEFKQRGDGNKKLNFQQQNNQSSNKAY